MMKSRTARPLTVTALIVLVGGMLSGCAGTGGWRGKLDKDLPAFGHRNWIVVADAAYPKQSAGGIETIVTGVGHLEVLDTVLKQIESSPHVKAKILVDAELESVSEEDAPGVSGYREALTKFVEGREVERMAHEEIIARLDEGAKMFDILLLKTNLTIPYTSVFLELDCGYWSAEKEERLRETIRKLGGNS